jgi:mannose-6-phosphate isomerase-like protein (cupin superfamily)
VTGISQQSAEIASGELTRKPLVPFTRASADETRSCGATRQAFHDLADASLWFDSVVTSDLDPGASDGVRTYPADVETFYQVVAGEGELVFADGTVEPLRQFDGVFFTPGASGELRATGDLPLTWLTISSAGRESTPFTAANGRGDGLLERAAGDVLAPEIFRYKTTAPRQWPSNPLGASAKPWWFYTVNDHSRWYHTACIACVAPGGASTFHTHMLDFEGPYETWYIVLRGSALIRSEFEDFVFDFDAPCGVFVPCDAPHQISNNGDDFLWYYTLSSRGDAELVLDTYAIPSGVDRPGYLEEYNRIIASRAARGLPIP